MLRDELDRGAKASIGILGGMGPEATLELFRKIIELTPADKDQDHLRVIIDSNPAVPDRTAAILHRGESPLPSLQKTAQILEGAGADLITIPCNSAHYYLASIREAVKIPVLDMIEETASRIREQRVGLLATDGTLSAGLYQKACTNRGIELLEPQKSNQKVVMQVIYRIKAGEKGISLEQAITQVIENLKRRGAEAVIAGCTELSLILDEGDLDTPLYDALSILAQVAVQQALSMS